MLSQRAKKRNSQKPSIFQVIQDRQYSAQTLGIVFIGINLLITIPLAAVLNIWFDEAYSLNTTGHTLRYAFSQAIGFEEQAPVYFVFLFLWRQINGTIFWARLFSISCIAGVIGLSPYLSRLYLKQLHPAYLTAIVALNPFIVWMAIEVRLYALSTLIAAILLYLFPLAYLKRTPNRWHQLIYSGVALIGLYTHYFLGLLLVANGVVLLMRSGPMRSSPMRSGLTKRRLITYVGHMLIVGLCFIPMVVNILGQISQLSDNTTISTSGILTTPESSLPETVYRGVIKSVGTLLFYTIPAPTPEDWQWARVLVVSMALAWGVRWRHFITRTVWQNLGMVGVLVLLFAGVFSAVGHLHFRHAAPLMLPSLIAVLTILALPTKRLGNENGRRSLSIGVSLILAWNIVCLGHVYSPLAKDGDSDRVAAYLTQNEQPGQPILVFNSEVEMVLSHYYDGVNDLIALPKPEDFVDFSTEDLVLSDEEEIWTALEQHQPSNKGLWLVTDEGVLTELPTYDESYQILERFITHNYRVITDADFYGARVRLLESI